MISAKDPLINSKPSPPQVDTPAQPQSEVDLVLIHKSTLTSIFNISKIEYYSSPHLDGQRLLDILTL